MADYIYLLENRLSRSQRNALLSVREIGRLKGLTVFLVGGAVRDLTSGSPVRDLDVVVQGNALKLRKEIEKGGGKTSGEAELFQALFVQFPGGVRMEIGSTLSVSYPKPGKPVAKPGSILDDLRRRDFTANAMALSLNDGSYGLLMDPLNGVADIENRELRLISNYGFIEDPVRMIRAARLMARLGWQMDEKTQSRYETGKQEGYISVLDDFHRGYETEEIFHEEDPLRVLKRLEAEGWIQHLFPSLSAAKANVAELERLRDSQTQLEMQGIYPDPSVANFPQLTAKMAAKEIEALKRSFPRRGFVQEIESLESEGKAFAAEFSGKGAASPSQAWKLLHAAKPESVLWVAHTSKNAGIQTKFKGFYTEWAQAKQRLPYVLMQEMRILPDLPGYEELLDKIFFELMDGKLATVEEMKAFLEPHSPPAPPPPVHLRRPRVAKKDAKPAKSRKKAAVEGEAAGGSGVQPAEMGEQPVSTQPVEKTVKAPVPATAKSPAAAQAASPQSAAASRKQVPPRQITKVPAKAAGKKHKAKVRAMKAVVAKAPAKKTPAKAANKPVVKRTMQAKQAKKTSAKAVTKKTSAKTSAKGPAKNKKKTALAKKPVSAKPSQGKKQPSAKKTTARKAPTRKPAGKKRK